ncbi:MAG: aminotransferase class I/II-fold pyridoxal phosphate-dependent enzyme [Mucilaginibacter polytrichastri]|nr:aminotransferase class I/II-fold pyridoxal phosphate-dependent enzyme [Mucilaginibacter polytrichastri]
MKTETIAVHAGNPADESTGAVISPLITSTTFLRNADGGYTSGYQYGRSANPNRAALENVLAALEGGKDAAAFSSGVAAGMTLFQALEPGSHILAPDDMYHGLRYQLLQVFQGILSVSFVDMSDLAAVENALQEKTRLIWLETPSNPLLKITDIRAVSAIAKKHNLLVAVDSTFASPIFQRPLELGADIVMHSSTKYLGGHSDIIGGALICRELNDFWKRIKSIQGLGGAVPSPFDCHLLIRSIKTLPWRMRAHEQNARLITDFLYRNRHVEQVFYPGIDTHPGHAIAREQMSGFGGMFSFLLKGGEEHARKVVNATNVFTQATSLGGVESLIEHRYSIEGPESKTPKNLIRVSVGLENSEDLIADLAQAMEK